MTAYLMKCLLHSPWRAKTFLQGQPSAVLNWKSIRTKTTFKREDGKLPYLVNTVYYQPDKIDEVVKVFFEMMVKYPHDENLGDLILVGANIRTANGIKAMGIVNVKKGKLEEMMALAANQTTMFRNISGTNIKTEVWNTVEEGLAPLGISMPT